jgi:hypothetical protein
MMLDQANARHPVDGHAVLHFGAAPVAERHGDDVHVVTAASELAAQSGYDPAGPAAQRRELVAELEDPHLSGTIVQNDLRRRRKSSNARGGRGGGHPRPDGGPEATP